MVKKPDLALYRGGKRNGRWRLAKVQQQTAQCTPTTNRCEQKEELTDRPQQGERHHPGYQPGEMSTRWWGWGAGTSPHLWGHCCSHHGNPPTGVIRSWRRVSLGPRDHPGQTPQLLHPHGQQVEDAGKVMAAWGVTQRQVTSPWAVEWWFSICGDGALDSPEWMNGVYVQWSKLIS